MAGYRNGCCRSFRSRGLRRPGSRRSPATPGAGAACRSTPPHSGTACPAAPGPGRSCTPGCPARNCRTGPRRPGCFSCRSGGRAPGRQVRAVGGVGFRAARDQPREEPRPAAEARQRRLVLQKPNPDSIFGMTQGFAPAREPRKGPGGTDPDGSSSLCVLGLHCFTAQQKQ